MRPILILLTLLFIALSSFGQVTVAQDSSGAKIDTLVIRLGDKRYFSGEEDSNGNLVFTEVSADSGQEKCLSIALSYGSMGTILTVKHSFSKRIFYKAELYVPKKKSFLETSVVPVYPKISSMEMWPNKIETIRLTGFKLND